MNFQIFSFRSFDLTNLETKYYKAESIATSNPLVFVSIILMRCFIFIIFGRDGLWVFYSIGKLVWKKVREAAPIFILSVFLEVEAVVLILNRIILSMFNVWISMRRRISPFFEILRFVLDAIHLHVSSDGPLLLFQPLFLSGRQSIVPFSSAL